MKRLAALIATLTISVSCHEPELTKLIPREALFGNPEKTSPAISYDGKLLAYLAPSDGIQNVWVRTIGEEDDHVVTSEREDGIYAYDWQPDSEHILYRQARGGNAEYHLYQTSIRTKETLDLTPLEGVRVRGHSIDPAFPDEMLVALSEGQLWLADEYRLNLKTGELRLDTENPGDIVSWCPDNRMRVRAAGSYQPAGTQEIRVRQDETSPWTVLQRWGPEEPWSGPIGFSPDDRAVLLSSSVDANNSRLLEVDIETGTTKVLAEHPQYGVGWPMVHPRTKELQAVPFLGPRLEWKFFDESVRQDFDELRTMLKGEVRIVSRDYEDATWIVAYDSDAGPVFYYAYDRASQDIRFLFTDRPALGQYQLANTQPISFNARDGMTIHGYLTMPVGAEGKAPAVLLVHGGPASRDEMGFNPLVQLLANRGYAVLQINFRGSSGLGKDYLNAGDREWGGKMQDDLIDGKRWAVDEGYADPDLIAIMGQSYGGYSALVGLTFTPNEFACGVAISGPSNQVTHLSTTNQREGPVRALWDRRVGDPEKDGDFLRSRSPLFQADRITRPLLIVHGATDQNVRQAESDQMVTAIREHNLPVDYIVFPDEGHNITYWKPENNLRLMAAVEDFFAKCLGGRSELPSAREEWKDLLR